LAHINNDIRCSYAGLLPDQMPSVSFAAKIFFGHFVISNGVDGILP
jgi:hypothetical protein